MTDTERIEYLKAEVLRINRALSATAGDSQQVHMLKELLAEPQGKS